MGWERYFFKGKNDQQAKKVWAEVNSDGGLKVDDGLVKIKFTESEDAKEYTAAKDNLSETAPADDSTSPDPVELNPRPPKINRTPPAELNLPSPGEDEEVIIYTDGATSSPTGEGSGPSGIGVVFWDGENYKEISQYIGRTTNQVAELQAINCALENLRTPEAAVRIYTDSQYSRRALTDWIDNWRQNGWVNSSGDPVANQGIIKEISNRLDKFEDLRINWVEGHAGEALNERADTLAVRAVDSFK